MNTNDFIIIIPQAESWYTYLAYLEELKKENIDALLIDRFHGNTVIVSEEQMNKLGWYKNGQ